MKPMTLQSPFTGWLHYPIVQIAVREGLKSFCFLPLISRNRAIGTLVLARLRDDAFSQGRYQFPLPRLQTRLHWPSRMRLRTARFGD